ncbi:MAG: hypothetical protein LZ168_00490 [Thaumarchaeota archaeon]|nr:hypothetical protein [Candidatus Geocrenenecus arthurdayi]
MARVSLAVEAEVAQALSKLAEEKHMTLYSLTNQILKTAIELLRENLEIQDLKDLLLGYTILRDLDAVVLPSDFMDSLISELYTRDKELVLKKFRQLGRDVGKYLKVYTESFEDLLQLAHKVGRFFPLKRLESRYISREQYELVIVGVGRRIESTECVYEAMNGILEEYDVKIIEGEMTKGLIKVKVSIEK